MHRIAETLGVDPVKLREKNALRAGDLTATGQKLRKDCSALQVLKQAVKRSVVKDEGPAGLPVAVLCRRRVSRSTRFPAA